MDQRLQLLAPLVLPTELKRSPWRWTGQPRVLEAERLEEREVATRGHWAREEGPEKRTRKHP